MNRQLLTAASDDTLIIEAIDGSQYCAQFRNGCSGLSSTHSLAFMTRGTNRLDRFSGVVLPRGQRCLFDSLEPVAEAVRSAEFER